MLENALRTGYPTFTASVTALARLGIAAEWNYHSDSHAWLCTNYCIRRLHVYEGSQDLFFYRQIPPSHRPDPALKEAFYRREPTGKLPHSPFRSTAKRGFLYALALIRIKQSPQ